MIVPVTLILLGFAALIPLTYAQSNGVSTSNLTGGNWTTYTNEVIGISFDYPSGWGIKEKQNRFDSVADVIISDDTNHSQFRISKSEGPFTSDVGDSTRYAEKHFDEEDELEIIESTDVKKYEIGGDKTATFLAKSDEEDSQYGIQFIYVIHKENLYLLAFRDLTSTFDTPASQSILNKFIQSFRFLS